MNQVTDAEVFGARWDSDAFPWDDLPDESPPSATPVQDWADKLNADIAEPLLEGQRQIAALQQQINELGGIAQSIAVGSNAATERRNTLLFLWILFIGVAYIQVVHPLIRPGTKLGDEVRANATSVHDFLFKSNFCQKIIFPVNAPITSQFGMRKHPITGAMKMHNGVDFGADPGAPIAAALSGKVKTVGKDPNGYGNYLVIDHGEGLETLYGHTSKILVPEGVFVAQGTAIALVGSTGSSTAPHLHWETTLDGKPTNPENWLGKEWGTRCSK